MFIPGPVSKKLLEIADQLKRATQTGNTDFKVKAESSETCLIKHSLWAFSVSSFLLVLFEFYYCLMISKQ